MAVNKRASHSIGETLKAGKRSFLSAFQHESGGVALLVVILLLVVVVVAMAGRIGADVYQRHQDVDRLLEAERLTNVALELSAAIGRERGWTAAYLGSDKESGTLRNSIVAYRKEVNDVWSRYLETLMDIRARYADSQKYDFAWSQLIRAKRDYDALRALVDSRTVEDIPAQFENWFDTASDLVEFVWEMSRAISRPVPRELGSIWYFTLVRDYAWTLSELAGQERGLLAYYITRGSPVVADHKEHLKSIAKKMEHSVYHLESVMEDAEVDEGVRDALQILRVRLYNRFALVRDEAYDEIDTGRYPLNGREWLEEATAAVESTLDVSSAIMDAFEKDLRVLYKSSRRDLIFTVSMLLLVCFIVLYAVNQIRELILRLHERRRMAEITLGSVGDGVITTDAAGNVIDMNPVAEKMTGWCKEDAVGESVQNVFRVQNRITRENETDVVAKCLSKGQVFVGSGEGVLVAADETETAIQHTVAPIHDVAGGVKGVVLVFYDLFSPLAEQRILSYHATHDALTGLANRWEFEKRLQSVCATEPSDRGVHALCVIDLDQFKVVNDTCGHDAGDLLLKQIAEVMRRHVRRTDLLARFGGDEFGLLLAHCERQRALEIAEQLRRVVTEMRFSYDGHTFTVGLSIGMVYLDSNETNPRQYLALADAACYAAKEKGRNRIHITDPNSLESKQLQGDAVWATRIREALLEDRFVLYCQPIVTCDAQQPFGYEMLVRMRDIDGSLVMPGAFIPTAERHGLMTDIDKWVISKTLDAMSEMNEKSENRDDWVAFINLSGASLTQDSMAEHLRQELNRHCGLASRLCFEVTETSAILNLPMARRFIKQFRALGSRFALDDFGTGLSSFSYLKELPVDYLKIGGAFVRDISDDPSNQEMVSATHRIAISMGMKTIAENVETEQAARWLNDLNITYMQGYWIKRPMPIYEIALPPRGEEAYVDENGARKYRFL